MENGIGSHICDLCISDTAALSGQSWRSRGEGRPAGSAMEGCVAYSMGESILSAASLQQSKLQTTEWHSDTIISEDEVITYFYPL